MSPHEAYYKGRTLKTTLPDWDSIKYDIMYDILKTKFEDPALKALLLNNTDDEIIIINNHHDREWGVCNCSACNNTGYNALGKLLTQLREELR